VIVLQWRCKNGDCGSGAGSYSSRAASYTSQCTGDSLAVGPSPKAARSELKINSAARRGALLLRRWSVISAGRCLGWRQGWKLIWPYAGLYLAQASPFWRIFRLPLGTRPRMWIDRRCTDSVGRAWPCWRWIREHERHTRRSCSGRSFNWPLADLLGFALMLAVGGFRRRGQRRGRASARDMCRTRCNPVCTMGAGI
jgi:hypothetical protein